MNKLNEKQQLAVKRITEYILNPNPDISFITISGPGGSGKTYLLKQALLEFKRTYNICGATISHFAKDVLGDSLGEDYTVMTVASLLGKIMSHDKKTGATIMKNSREASKVELYDILIIDEVSMIDDKTFNELLSYNKKIIAIGDRYQLPPVNQDHDSLFFEKIDVELTEVMRFKGPIYDLSMLYIEEIKHYNEGERIDINILSRKTKRISNLNELGSGYVFLNELVLFLRLAAQEFKKYENEVNGCRIIAYKNRTIEKLNKTIRRVLFGKDANEFEVNELIISDGGIFYYENRKRITMINNGESFRIKQIQLVRGPHGIMCNELILDKPMPKPIYVVAKEGKRAYDEDEEYYKIQAKNSTNWVKYHNFINSFAKFNYSYVVSSHKVQGSSINTVYVLEEEIMNVKPITPKEKFQSLYVGITRAKHRVYIYNENKKIDNSLINIKENRYIK